MAIYTWLGNLVVAFAAPAAAAAAATASVDGSAWLEGADIRDNCHHCTAEAAAATNHQTVSINRQSTCDRAQAHPFPFCLLLAS